MQIDNQAIAQPAPPRGALRALLAAPQWLYRARLGFLLGHRFLVLVHVGRRTGRVRRTVLEVVSYDSRSREAMVVAGWGSKTQWLHNVEAGLAREVWIGRERYVPAWRRVAAGEAEQVLLDYEEGSHVPRRLINAVLSRLLGWRYDAGVDARRRAVRQLPFIGFRPAREPRPPSISRDYSEEPADAAAHRRRFNRFYTRVARAYDLFVKVVPLWRRWLRRALPYLEGPRVLEVSFGTGYLLTQYAGRFEVHGVDLNERMVALARENVRRAGLHAELRQGAVESLPYPDRSFDCVLCTMAFSGYPNARAALAEMVRVVRPGGRLVLIDVNYPADGNRLGTWATELWKRVGDIVRDLDALFAEFGLAVTDEEIGGWGSVHLYVAVRRDDV